MRLLVLLAPALTFLVLRRLLRKRTAKHSCGGGGGRGGWTTATAAATGRTLSLGSARLGMRHWREYLMLRARISLCAMLNGSSLLLLGRRHRSAAAAIAADPSRGVPSPKRGTAGRTPIVVRQQTTGTVYSARYSGRNRLMDGDRTSAAVSGRRLVPVAGLPFAFALAAVQVPVSLLFTASHVFLVLHSAESHLVAMSLLFYFAVSVVRRGGATTVGVLVVHAHLEGLSQRQIEVMAVEVLKSACIDCRPILKMI